MHYKIVGYSETAAKLKVARLDKGLTGMQAADLAFMAQPEVSRVENGKQKWFTESMREKTERLAQVLGVSDVRWQEATEQELREVVLREATEEVVEDERRSRRKRILSFFVDKHPALDTARKTQLAVDLGREGILTQEEALLAVEAVCIEAQL